MATGAKRAFKYIAKKLVTTRSGKKITRYYYKGDTVSTKGLTGDKLLKALARRGKQTIKVKEAGLTGDALKSAKEKVKGSIKFQKEHLKLQERAFASKMKERTPEGKRLRQSLAQTKDAIKQLNKKLSGFTGRK